MWPAYLSMLAAQRFNRFNLALGIGYDFLPNVTDAYFLFAYPFLLDVPGYNVRVPQLPDAERDRNLEMLRFISRADRGARHGVPARALDARLRVDQQPERRTTRSRDSRRRPTGRIAATPSALLLKACPEITGVTLRVHGESGVEEGSYEFWKTRLRRRGDVRPQGRDRHARQGHGPEA